MRGGEKEKEREKERETERMEDVCVERKKDKLGRGNRKEERKV